MYKNGTYGSISSGGSSQTNSTRREAEEKDRRKARAAAKMSDDLDISAILAATSITSITGMPSSKTPSSKQQQQPAQQDRNASAADRGKGKGKEKARDGEFGSDKGKRRSTTRGSNEPIFHTVSGADTLEGIALKYGVQVADIKRVNRLFSNQDLWARKELVIPSPEELEEETVRPRRSYEKDITSPRGRRSYDKDAPKYVYPATPEDEVADQRRSLLGFSSNFSSDNGEASFRGLDTEGSGVRIKQMGAKVRRRLEEDEDKLYGL
jgi:LysM repeat protein